MTVLTVFPVDVLVITVNGQGACTGAITSTKSPQFTIVANMDDGLESLEPNVLYVPEKTNESAFDSFILVDYFLRLFIFQMTSRLIHDINDGLTPPTVIVSPRGQDGVLCSSYLRTWF